MKTIFPKEKQIQRKWYCIDAEGVVLGRLAVQAVNLARGKHKAVYTPNLDLGDGVIIINADKVAISGRKRTDKSYYRHSGYPGGLTIETFEKVIARKPTFPLEHAIKGMLPKGALGNSLFRRIKIYAGSQHPHEAQQPENLEIKS